MSGTPRRKRIASSPQAAGRHGNSAAPHAALGYLLVEFVLEFVL
ncbi:hypothetical protein [Adlercreutzia faecimuris]|nr:hypothetical protein [Adlercreutzia sp. JBNU-10]